MKTKTKPKQPKKNLDLPIRIDMLVMKLQEAVATSERCKKEIETFKEKANLANMIIFYLLKEAPDATFSDETKTVFNKVLSSEFENHMTSPKPVDFRWEIVRDILARTFIVAASRQPILEEFPTPDMSPIYGKG